MTTWNMFSREVSEERSTVRAYGVDNIENRVRHGDSYKAQALRELAKRLELEEKIKELKRQVNDLLDRVEVYEQ